MTPEMERALRAKYPARKLRTVDALLMDRDPYAKQLILFFTTPDNVY